MSVNTSATGKGMLQEKVFDGSSPTFRLRVPGYTQEGDEIGAGGGGGGGLTNELLEGYMGAAALNDSVGKATLTLVPNTEFAGSSLKPAVGDYILIQDVGNARPPFGLEFVAQQGDPTTLPVPTRSIPLANGPTSYTRTQLASFIATAINEADTYFNEPAMALKAQAAVNVVTIVFTGEGGASGGTRAYDANMDVSFSLGFTGTDPITGLTQVTMSLSHDNLKDTTLDSRLAKIDKGDGCIVVPLSHVAGGVWTASYPVHPRGIEVTHISLSVGAGNYSVTGPNYNGEYVSLKVGWGDGTQMVSDVMGYIESVIPAYAGAEGFPLAINLGGGGWPLDTTVTYPITLRRAQESTFQSPPDNGYYPIVVSVTSNDPGSTAPANGASKLMIFFRVLN